PAGVQLTNMCLTDRYHMFKAGPVLSVSHGMGIPSISILLHEITKLLHYARAPPPTYFRIGSSGGIGMPPGSVVITSEAVDAELQPFHTLRILGSRVERPARFNLDLANELAEL